MNMKGRENRGPAPPADLLVCFPARAHLTIRPKPICSPARPSEPSTSHSHHHHRPSQLGLQPNHPRKSTANRAGAHPSPLLWAKSSSNKPNNSDMSESEPSSPKVTCAGQIKARPRPGACKNWQSVMEEIERMHNNKKKKKKSPWAGAVDALGIKKDAMQFLACLRNIRFDFRCFGAFPTTAVISSDDEDEDDDDEDEEDIDRDRRSGDVFSKWFMALPEEGKMITPCLDEEEEEEGDGAAAPPPPNALMLMRCRSAPAKSWLEEKLEEEEEKEGKDRLVVMTCGAEFSKLSADIAKETWVVGGMKDMLSRSRSSRR